MAEQAEVDKLAKMATEYSIRIVMENQEVPRIASLFKLLCDAYEMGFDRATTVIQQQLLKDLSEGKIPHA